MTVSPPPAAQRTPRVLLVGLLPGAGGMHLPRHLARAGLELVFLGSRANLASRSKHVKAVIPWPTDGGGLTIPPFIDCLRQVQPQWIVPIDEMASQVVQQFGVGRLPGADVPLPDDIVTLVRQSLGEPAGYPLHHARQRAHAVARRAGIPVPAQADAPDLAACLAFAGQHGYPVILKQEGSVAGIGTFVMDNEAALRTFVASGRMQAAATSWVVQQFVPGTLGMYAVFAERGRVLAQAGALQVTRRGDRATAPSSVVKLMRHDAMAASCAAFVAATGASGFHGWDFQLDDAGRAVMIEHNPRPISISHLGHLIGDDLCKALARVCGVDTAAPAPSDVTERTVAFFPDEWQRDPQSPHLHDAFHDAPWDDEPLIRAILLENIRFV